MRNLNILQLDCIFEEDLLHFLDNTKILKKLSNITKFFIHAPPICNGYKDKRFDKNIDNILELSKKINSDKLIVHAVISRKPVTKKLLIEAKQYIDNLPYKIRTQISIESGFSLIFPQTIDQINVFKDVDLTLDISHAFFNGGIKNILELAEIFNPKIYHLSDCNPPKMHLPIGEGIINFSEIKPILKGALIFEIIPLNELQNSIEGIL